MTAINLAVQPTRRAAYLISDCAWTHPDGRIERIAGKIISFARFPCAIGTNGRINMAILGAELEKVEARNLRTLVSALPSCLRRALDGSAKVAGVPRDELMATLKVAAWSARLGRPTGYMISSDAFQAQMYGLRAPFEVWGVDHSLDGAADLDELLGKPPAAQLSDAGVFDPHEEAFALVAEQRRRGQFSITPNTGTPGISYRIGGEVELTEVTRRGVKVWCCGKFPDKVGELIQPDGAPRQPSAAHDLQITVAPN